MIIPTEMFPKTLNWLREVASKHAPEFDQALLTNDFIHGAWESWLLIPLDQRVRFMHYLGNLIGASYLPKDWEAWW